MTHSILMTIKVNSFDDVEEIKNRILSSGDEGWLTMFGLKKVPKTDIYPDVYPATKLPPFICFPKNKNEKEDDGTYHIIVESGSHCSFYDIQEALFMWMSWFCFYQEIDSYGIDFCYGIGIDGEDGRMTLKEALKAIIEDSELEEYIEVKK